ncbi:MAG: RNA polymerase sigma factor RpoD/SigA [Deferribacteraceae bacterium]|jgi:RNA polymerase primary sigma factor|nr:RNA polymerase sigma factor RpoD/SigA [Deferribacteraceae bacterium]
MEKKMDYEYMEAGIEEVEEAEEKDLKQESELETSVNAYMKRISDCKPLALEEEQKLGHIMRHAKNRETKKAFDKLIEANLKFVVSIANKYRNFGLPLEDLINQGNLGLVEAAKRYDPAKGVKFITYAVWWIRQYIFQGIAEQSGVIRLPLKQAQTAYKRGKINNRLRQKLQREPTVWEVADELGIKEKELSDITNTFKQCLSLETPIREGEERMFVSNLKSEDESTEDRIIRNSLEQAVSDMVDELDPREIDIINQRYGLCGREEKTLEELGKKFGISRERVRQIESRALEKLKKRAVQLKLQAYLAS